MSTKIETTQFPPPGECVRNDGYELEACPLRKVKGSRSCPHLEERGFHSYAEKRTEER